MPGLPSALTTPAESEQSKRGPHSPRRTTALAMTWLYDAALRSNESLEHSISKSNLNLPLGAWLMGFYGTMHEYSSKGHNLTGGVTMRVWKEREGLKVALRQSDTGDCIFQCLYVWVYGL